MSSSRIDRIVIASTGGWRSVSTHARLRPLAQRGLWPVEAFSADPFPSSIQLDPVVVAGGDGAVLILQRVLPATGDMRRLRDAFDRVVFDIDDAIYAVPPRVGEPGHVRLARNALRVAVRGSPRASSRRRPLIRTLRNVDVCVAGNSILADFARRFAPRTAEIPTTVDPLRVAPDHKPAAPVLVWLGLPDNLQYLELIRAPLAQLGKSARFRLRIVSGRTWDDAPVPVEFVLYSEQAAREALTTATAGLAPLTDDPWTRGKCAMRAVQYGGHGLASVASPVGITDRVVRPGETGFLPRSHDEWLDAMRVLVSDRERAAEMGAQALDHIRLSFSNALATERWIRVLSDAAGAGRSAADGS